MEVRKDKERVKSMETRSIVIKNLLNFADLPPK